MRRYRDDRRPGGARLIRDLGDHEAWGKHADEMWAAYDQWNAETCPPTPPGQRATIEQSARCLVVRTTRAQGLPYVTDPETIRRVAAVLVCDRRTTVAASDRST